MGNLQMVLNRLWKRNASPKRHFRCGIKRAICVELKWIQVNSFKLSYMTGVNCPIVHLHRFRFTSSNNWVCHSCTFRR